MYNCRDEVKGSGGRRTAPSNPSGAEIDHVRFTHGVFLLGGFLDEGDVQLEIVWRTNRFWVRQRFAVRIGIQNQTLLSHLVFGVPAQSRARYVRLNFLPL